MKRIAIGFVLLASTLSFGAAPQPDNKLTPAEVQRLRYLAYRKTELQKLIDAFNAESKLVTTEIRTAHKFGPNDTVDVDSGSIVRKAEKK